MSRSDAAETSTTPDALRQDFVSDLAQVPPSDLGAIGALRRRYRRRARELDQVPGSRIDTPEGWLALCLKTGVPTALLERALTRLEAEGRAQLGRRPTPLREVLRAREDWHAAEEDPGVPPVLLHVLYARLGGRTSASPMAQDLAHPREIAEGMRVHYPHVAALDPQLFRKLTGARVRDHTPSVVRTETTAPRTEKSGVAGWWVWFLAAFLAFKACRAMQSPGLEVRDRPRFEMPELPSQLDPLGPAPADDATYRSLQYQRSRLVHLINALDIALIAESRTGTIGVRRQALVRRALDRTPVTVPELRSLRRALAEDDTLGVREMNRFRDAAGEGVTRLDREMAQRLEQVRRRDTEGAR